MGSSEITNYFGPMCLGLGLRSRPPQRTELSHGQVYPCLSQIPPCAWSRLSSQSTLLTGKTRKSWVPQLWLWLFRSTFNQAPLSVHCCIAKILFNLFGPHCSLRGQSVRALRAEDDLGMKIKFYGRHNTATTTSCWDTFFCCSHITHATSVL